MGLGIGSGAHRISLCAMDANTDEVSERLPWIGCHLLRLWRVRSEYCWDIGGSILKHHVRCRNPAEVTASTSELHPRRRCVRAISCKHVELCVGGSRRGWVENRIGPIGEGNAEVARAIGIKVAEAVAYWHTMAISVDTCKRGQDIRFGVGDELRVVIGEQHTIALNKVEQVGHLIKIRVNVRIVTREVSIVKLDVDHMLDVTFGRVEQAAT